MLHDTMYTGLSMLPFTANGRSRAINAENPTGRPGAAAQAASHLGTGRKGSPCIRDIPPGDTVTLAEIQGPGIINHIWFTVTDRTDEEQTYVLRDLVLRMYWDDEKTPSVEVPLGDFFCSGFARAPRVVSMPIVVLPTRGFNTYFQMPFGSKAKITVENQHVNSIPHLFYQIDYCEYDSLPGNTAYFHAQWRRECFTQKAQDYVVLDGVKGKGHFVGMYLALTALERFWWGEGEVKFYMDGDTEYPTICSTGAEDYFGGAWSFATQENGLTVENTYNSPFLGFPYLSREDRDVHHHFRMNDTPTERGLYRWHVLDPIRFEKELKITFQQIGYGPTSLFERSDDVATVAYWYQTEPHTAFPALMEKQQRWPR